LYRVKESGGRGGGGKPEREKRTEKERRWYGMRVRKDKVAGEGQGSSTPWGKAGRETVHIYRRRERARERTRNESSGIKIDRAGREKEGQNQSAGEKEERRRSACLHGMCVRVYGGGRVGDDRDEEPAGRRVEDSMCEKDGGRERV